MTKPLTDRLREYAPDPKRDLVNVGPGLGRTIHEAAKALEEARELLGRVSHLNSFRELNDFLPTVRFFLATEERESQPEAKRTTPRSN